MAAVRKLAMVAVLLSVAGCSSSGGVQATNLPPAGTVWFGTSFDTTTFVIAGQASSFPQSGQVALVARLSKMVPGGQPVNLLVDGIVMKSAAASSSDYDAFGSTLTAAQMTTGSHAVTVTDAGGNLLASGSVTITP